MDAKKALNIVAGQCSKKEYCSFDILKKLQRWELEEKDIAAVMEFLVKNHFLDDTRFAEAYARDKHRFNRWGKLKIMQMLRNVLSNRLCLLYPMRKVTPRVWRC